MKLSPVASCSVALVLAACGCSSAGSEAPTATSAALSTSRITGIGGKCVDVRGANAADSTTVQLWDCLGNDAQNWTYTNGTFVGLAGKCLDAEYGASANGTRVQLYTCNGTAAQQWTIEGTNIVGPGGKCLDVQGNTDASGTPLILWDCWGGPNQTWHVEGSSTSGSGPDPSPSPPPTGVAMGNGPVMRAQDLLDTLGVNTHIDFTFIPIYQDRQHVIDAVRYLGMKHLRDDPGNPADVGPGGWWQQVADATGARFDAFLAEGSPASVQSDLEHAKQLASQGLLEFLEGGNEEDDAYAVQNGNTLAWTAGYQPTVMSTARALGIPAINMSFGSGWTADNDWHGDYDKVGDLSAFCDFANAHTYPAGAPRSDIHMLNDDAHIASSSRPVIATEFGYDTHVTDPNAAAKWSLDAVFDGVKEGDVKTYFYAIFDDGSGAFGLMNDDLSPKPAGFALHNLAALLADGGPAASSFQSSALDFTLSGADDSLLLQKSDGSYWLAIWNERTGAHEVTLSLGSSASQIQVFDPLAGTDATEAASSAASLSIAVPDHPVLVKIMR